jgi:hypothetical protein
MASAFVNKRHKKTLPSISLECCASKLQQQTIQHVFRLSGHITMLLVFYATKPYREIATLFVD